MSRTLVLTIDMAGTPDFAIRAMQHQMGDWIQANKAVLPFETLVIFPSTGETRLWWLEGDPTDIKDKKTIEEIKDRLKPVLEIALDIKIDKEGLFKRPKEKYSQALRKLNEIRQPASGKQSKLHLP